MSSLICGIEEGEQPVIAGEEIILTLTTTKVGSNPTSPTIVSAYDLTAGTEAKSTIFPTGTPSAVGDVITLPVMKGLTAGHRYRVRVQFTTGGNKPIVQFIVRAEE